MEIEITPEVQQLIHGIFAEGHYDSESEVLAAAVQLLHQRQQLRKDLEQGCRELDAGQRLNAEDVFRDLRARAAKIDGSAS